MSQGLPFRSKKESYSYLQLHLYIVLGYRSIVLKVVFTLMNLQRVFLTLMRTLIYDLQFFYSFIFREDDPPWLALGNHFLSSVSAHFPSDLRQILLVNYHHRALDYCSSLQSLPLGSRTLCLFKVFQGSFRLLMDLGIQFVDNSNCKLDLHFKAY